MAMLEAFIADGTVTLLALGVLAIELAIVVAVAVSRRARPATDLVANVFSGLFLILALRAALVGSGAAVAGFLGLALVAHLTDLASRLRSSWR